MYRSSGQPVGSVPAASTSTGTRATLWVTFQAVANTTPWAAGSSACCWKSWRSAKALAP